MKYANVYKLIGAIAVSELAGFVGATVTTSSLPVWYAGLAKPPLNPPPWIFAPVWTTLYLLMGIAAFLVWRKGRAGRGTTNHETRRALSLFMLQLFLNSLWSIIFFGLHSPGWAFLEILLLAAAIIWTMVAFSKISRTATYLLVPYIAWVTFAAYLNLAIWIRN